MNPDRMMRWPTAQAILDRAARQAGVALNRVRRGLHLLGMGDQRCTEFGQRIAARTALDQGTAELLFQRTQAALDGRLIDAESFRCRAHAPGAGYRQEVSQVIPVEHGGPAILRRARAKSRLPPSRLRW
jgi:hypothetical protein